MPFLLDLNDNSVNVFLWNFLAKIGKRSQKLEEVWSNDLPAEQERGLGL